MSDTPWYCSAHSCPRLQLDSWGNCCFDHPQALPAGIYIASHPSSAVGPSSYSYVRLAICDHSTLASSRVPIGYQFLPTGFPGYDHPCPAPSLPHIDSLSALGNPPDLESHSLSLTERLDEHYEVQLPFPTHYPLGTSQSATADKREGSGVTKWWQILSTPLLSADSGSMGKRLYPDEQSIDEDMGTSPIVDKKPMDICGHMRSDPYPRLEKSMGLHSRTGIDSCPNYSSRKALFLHWKEDGDLPGCTFEVCKLEEMFRRGFGFQTVIFSIPEIDAERETIECINQFFLGTKKDDLLVVYYAGHAIQHPFAFVRYICPIIRRWKA